MLRQKNNIKLRNYNNGLKTILTFKDKRTVIWHSAFIKTQIVFRTFVPRQLLATWGFPLFILTCLLMKRKVNTQHKSAKQSIF